jgi:predicted GNAT family N-acyltransferase
MYAEDATPGIFHLAARTPDGTVIGCVTFFPEDAATTALPEGPHPGHSWRFRGMATVEAYRGQGIGGELIETGVAEAATRGGTRIWCNGRAAAADFYRRHGFSTVGEQFEIAPVGLHYFFERALR